MPEIRLGYSPWKTAQIRPQNGSTGVTTATAQDIDPQTELTALSMDLCHCCLRKVDVSAATLTKMDSTQVSHYLQIKGVSI